MKLSRRAAWLMLWLGTALVLGLVFRGFIYASVVVPLGVLLLLFWRLALSVHQAIYWGALTAAAAGLVLYRVAQALSAIPESPPSVPDAVLRDIDYWRLSIQLSSSPGPAVNSLRGELARLLVAVYAAERPESTLYGLYEALRRRQIPLPDSLHAFLFASDSPEAGRPWAQRLKSLATQPRIWVRRWTGREKAEFYHAIADALTFMEAQMEIKHGDDYFDPSHH